MLCAIIVAFNPEESSFKPLLLSLSRQVDQQIIVDNSPRENNDVLEYCLAVGLDLSRTSLIRLGANFGIGTALNVGIQEAMRQSVDFILLSDQDSLPSDGMVENLRSAFEELAAQGIRLGAIGPTYTDLYTRLTYPFQVKLPGCFFYGHQVPTANTPHVEVLTLITSGTLITVSVFREVGLMREDFFIDQVDVEWCHRARWKGYRLFGTGWATMYQRMGEARLRVWYKGWRYESAYSPLRIYYRLRNFVALWKLDFIDWRWKLRSSWYSLGIVYAHFFFGEHCLETLRMSARGVWDGVRGRMGRFPSP